jgi:thiamine biosynthesis lipoprotein
LTAAAGPVRASRPEQPPEQVRLERSLDAMGTTYTVALYGTDRFVLDAAVEDAFEEVQRLDLLMSNYRPDSEWSKLNREAPRTAVRVSEETFDLLARCLDYSRRSEGAFDITVGPLMKIWGFYKGSGRIPHRAEIRTALARVGWRRIRLDPAARTVRFDAPVEIDPGGIGKGYAVSRMVKILKSRGISSGFIIAGRSSMHAIGAPPQEPRGWRVEIPNPGGRNKAGFVCFLKDQSMATSGSTEKFFNVGGRTYTHIMDPRTGYPAEGMLQVSVVAPDAIDSEAWTKPYFILGRKWAERNRPKDFQVFLCEDRSENACVSLQ